MMAELGFWNQAAADPQRLALVSPDGDHSSAGQLLAEANRLSHGLAALGLKKGDVVATCLPNGTAMIEAYLAAFQSGLYLVPINHHLVASEIAYILADSEAKAFIADQRFAEACAAAAEEAAIAGPNRLAAGSIDSFSSLTRLKEGCSSDTPSTRYAGQVMNYTSGTTGRPKGVRRKLPNLDPDSVGALYAMFLSLFNVEPGAGNVHLCGSPLYHTAVLMFVANSLHYGHTVVLMDKWNPEEFLGLIERYHVTTSHMVPTQFHRLLALPAQTRSKYDMSSLHSMIHAAAPCPVATKQQMLQWWGPVIYEYYAASEGGGTLVTPEEWLKYPGTVGRAWPTAEIKIFDEDGRECASGEPGTVYMLLGQNEFKYHKDETKTADNRRGNYFTVGDIGYLNEQGYLFLCDRKADMIISGGVNIYPAEIESVLLTHPKVADAAVFGIPHEDWGEEVKAVVEMAEGEEQGQQSGLADELIEYCSDKLAKYKRPRSIDFIAEMPRDPNGKLYKRKLRDPYWQGRQI